jgi:5-methylcytosine-specific restriction endonuclease McrA
MARFILCQWCQERPSYHLHHQDEDTTNLEPDNLVVLCSQCHNRYHNRYHANR